jgi:virginiamycin A acetyltransferase
MERLSLHPFFYNSQLGFVAEDTITSSLLEIGHDAWIGERAIITPGCSRVGVGAVIGAGAVVTKDVPDFGVVAGNPAKLLRFRFPVDVQNLIRDSKWWERSVEECARHIACLIAPLDRRQLFLNLLLADAERSRSTEQNGVQPETSHVRGE